MFEKRTSFSYWYDAIDVLDGRDEVIRLLINKSIIRQNGAFLELDDQFLSFFEEVLEVNDTYPKANVLLDSVISGIKALWNWITN